MPLKGEKSSVLLPQTPIEIPKPTGLPSVVPTIEITKETYKTIGFGSQSLDLATGGIEEGLNIIFGAPDTGKTNTCIHLTFNALALGWNVKYYDLERGVHRKRLLDIYEARGRPFDLDKLNHVFMRPKVWNWINIVEEWYRTIRLEKPDLFIVDSVTPAFLEKFEGEAEKEHWDTLKKRDLLAIDSYRTAFENNIVSILVAQEKGSKKETTDIQSSMAVDFAGMGNRFAYLAKMWLYSAMNESLQGDQMTTNRWFILLKHRFLPDYSQTHTKIPFKITSTGIDGA